MPVDNIILVVDDDPLVLSGTARLLRKEGYTVFEAQTGEQALRCAQRELPHLILLAVRQIRARVAQNEKNLRIIDLERERLRSLINNYQRAENQMTQQAISLQLFRDLIDQSDDAVFIVSPETSRFIDVNERVCEMLGYTREELLRMGVMDIDTGAGMSADFSWERHVEELRHLPGRRLESVHKRKDGSTFPVEINIRVLTLDDGEYMISVARDITKRKASEKESQKHRENLEQLVEERTEKLTRRTEDLERSQQALQYLLEDMNEAQTELKTKMAEIERMNRIFVKRELRMVELKEKIKELEKKGMDIG